MAVKPFSGPNGEPPAREVAEFMPQEGECAQPFVTYTNHLYVYPRSLKYEGQKAFPKVNPFKSTMYQVNGHHVCSCLQ